MERIERDLERVGFFETEQKNEGNKPKQNSDDLDLLPEFCRYRDEGCELFRSCLECPFPDCVEEQFRGCLKQARKVRNREIVRLHTVEKIGVLELVNLFGVSLSTVWRALASGRMSNERE
jgi:hypothetical protein